MTVMIVLAENVEKNQFSFSSMPCHTQYIKCNIICGFERSIRERARMHARTQTSEKLMKEEREEKKRVGQNRS